MRSSLIEPIFVDTYLAQLGAKLNSDGSITRTGPIPITILNPDMLPEKSSGHHVLLVYKDIPVNQSKNTLMRIFLANNNVNNALESPSPTTSTKLPLIIYYHGGGFILGSATEPRLHSLCASLITNIPCIVVSVGYRLAPYEDCVEALHSIKTTQDEWLTKYADFSKAYLMGSSAGGNIAYHSGLHAAVDDLGPLQIKGLILHQPFFGGTRRTNSELRLVDDMILPLYINDFMWEKALPAVADRDHEYSNPTAGINGSGEIIRKVGWKVLVTGCDGDPLVDRQIEFVKMLEDKGVKVVGKFDEGGCHGVEVFQPAKAKLLSLAINNFMQS